MWSGHLNITDLTHLIAPVSRGFVYQHLCSVAELKNRGVTRLRPEPVPRHPPALEDWKAQCYLLQNNNRVDLWERQSVMFVRPESLLRDFHPRKRAQRRNRSHQSVCQLYPVIPRSFYRVSSDGVCFECYDALDYVSSCRQLHLDQLGRGQARLQHLAHSYQ